ncbi:MAG: hypothetical protein FD176_1549 [Rhodospirillaceae bacterium]|nr:MAG: hypothetical protein FD176_1549 [Rhodospirillaceae bacterium]TNC96708.1 MAG: Uncharacterized protein FD119_1593 [Stygiobacter sp.]
MTLLNWMGSFIPTSSRAIPLVERIDLILTWIERTQQRRALARLDDRMLADIGLSRTQADQESAKPGWQE